MDKKVLLIVLCLLLLQGQLHVKANSAVDSYYTAGVVEFRPNKTASSVDMVDEHLKAYLEIINSAEANATDIIVFPESTLNNGLQLTYVPAPYDEVVPCQSVGDLYAAFLVQLSCAARRVSKYLVINLTEKENCTAAPKDPRPCASNGLNIYNTNVVFDREGRVVSRYRKVNLYTEPKNSTYEPEFAIFETDFGVRFGHFICFDMLFYTPAEELVVKYGVRDLIFTTNFYSELPFLTAVQLQQSWAWGNNVNLLAAGASNPEDGATGSGIYVGDRGALISTMVGDRGERKLYVAQIPKMNSSVTSLSGSPLLVVDANRSDQPQTGIALMRDPQIENFNSKLIDFNAQLNLTHRLCDDEFCCRFHIVAVPRTKTVDGVSYMYRIGVFKGKRTYVKKVWSDLQVCALYACANETVASCGTIFNANQTIEPNFGFESIHIEGDFAKAKQLLIMPNSLDNHLIPLGASQVHWEMNDIGQFYNAHFRLNVEADNLLTFGIYANYYERSTSSRLKISVSILLCVCSVALFPLVVKAHMHINQT